MEVFDCGSRVKIGDNEDFIGQIGSQAPKIRAKVETLDADACPIGEYSAHGLTEGLTMSSSGDFSVEMVGAVDATVTPNVKIGSQFFDLKPFKVVVYDCLPQVSLLGLPDFSGQIGSQIPAIRARAET